MSICLRDKFTSADCIRSITPFAWVANNVERPRLEKSSILRFPISLLRGSFLLPTEQKIGKTFSILHIPAYPWVLVTQAGVEPLQSWQKSPLRFLPSVPTLSGERFYDVGTTRRRRRARGAHGERHMRRTSPGDSWAWNRECRFSSCAHNSGQSAYVHTCERTYAKRSWEIQIGRYRHRKD